MQTQTKLVAGCILALVIGILAILPLMPFMLKTTRAQTNFEPHFDIDVPYVYFRLDNSSLDQTTRQFSIVINATNRASPGADLPDAAIEYFQIQVYTDKGPVENLTHYVGAAYNSSFTPQTFNSFIFSRDQWFDTRTSGGGTFAFNWSINQSHAFSISGSTNSLPSYQNADAIYLDIKRVGMVVFKANSTTVSAPDAGFITHIELEKYKDGFLHNTIIPNEQLSQIDLLKPNLDNAY